MAPKDIPSDILMTIFHFLEVIDLCSSCVGVSKLWREVSESNSIWKAHCDKLWEGKANVTIGLPFPYAVYRSNVSFSIKELKHILTARDIETGNLLEKAEFRNELEKSDYDTCVAHPALGGKWKASYVFSVLDAYRERIFDSEINGIEWQFFFKSNPTEFTSLAKFTSNRRGTNSFMMDPWPMENVTQLLWRRNTRGDIMIHHFPAHVISRRPDWSFCMQNDYVIFYQANFPGFNEERVRG